MANLKSVLLLQENHELLIHERASTGNTSTFSMWNKSSTCIEICEDLWVCLSHFLKFILSILHMVNEWMFMMFFLSWRINTTNFFIIPIIANISKCFNCIWRGTLLFTYDFTKVLCIHWNWFGVILSCFIKLNFFVSFWRKSLEYCALLDLNLQLHHRCCWREGLFQEDFLPLQNPRH